MSQDQTLPILLTSEGLHRQPRLVKWNNNSVIAIAAEDDVEAWRAGTMERNQIRCCIFVPRTHIFDGTQPIKEAAACGTYEDLEKIEQGSHRMIHEMCFYIPFSNPGGLESDYREFGEASYLTFRTLFGENAETYKFRRRPNFVRIK